MTRPSILAAAAALALMTGCASTSTPTAAFAALSDAERSSDSSANAKAALQADFERALALCDSYMLSLRESFYGSGKTEIAVATVGIVAGSIIVPALAAKASVAKSAIAGWGGVSGAANAAQYTLQQKGVSASRLGTAYEATRGEIKSATEKYSKATKNADRLVAVNDLFVACRYPTLPGADAPDNAAGGSP